MNEKWGWLNSLGKLLTYAVVTAVITISLAFAMSNAANKQALDLLRETRNAARAQACVLALPFGANGRDTAQVKLCFSENDLTPPNLVTP